MQQGQGHLLASERWILRLAPALGVATIAASALIMTEQEARWAKVFAGPTDQPGPLVWRVAVKCGSPDRPQTTATDVTLRISSGRDPSVVRNIHTDDEGVAWVSFERPRETATGPLDVTITEGPRLLAQGQVNLTKERWLTGARRVGGWFSGHHEGPIEIRVGVVDAMLLHPYASDIVVVLSEHGRPLSNQTVSVQTDGAEIVGATAVKRVTLITDSEGRTRLSVRPTDLAATLAVDTPQPSASRFVGSLPIRTGGFRVDRRGRDLIISSPVVRDQATIGLLTEQGLVDVRTVKLVASGNQASATVTYSSWPAPPLWAVVSSETELDSSNTLGWPLLDDSTRMDAHPARVVPNLLVLDGWKAVSKRLLHQRHRALYLSSSALFGVATLIAWVMIRSNRRHQQQVSEIGYALELTERPSLAERAPYALIAVLVTTAAIVGLACWAALGFQ